MPTFRVYPTALLLLCRPMMLIPLVSVAIVILIVYCTVQANAEPGLPRVGKSGLIGYISTALRFTLNGEQVLQEGWDEFSGQPFMVPTLAGAFIILGPKHVDLLRKSNDVVFNQPKEIDSTLQFDQTMNGQQRDNPYHIGVIRTDVTRAIASLVPDIVEEAELAMQDAFDPSKDSKPTRLPAFHTITYMISRINNRAILGTELCRNKEFIHVLVRFAETLIPYSQVLRWLPRLLRPVVYFILSSIFGGQKEPMKFIIPHLKQYLHRREKMEERPSNVAEFLIRNSGEEKERVEDLAMRVLHLNFASIHTTTIFLTQTLFELAVLPESDLESIRTEVMEALDMEGGWNKAALARFRLIDSVLKEVGRVHGLGILGLGRTVIRDGELEDGTRIPAGHTTAIYLKPIHRNPEIYPSPDVFDAFRFSKLRKEGENEAKRGFTTITNNYLPFGAGRHACPGRFFVAMELKVMIAQLLLNYDISLPQGPGAERPKNFTLMASILPDWKAELVFKRRPGPQGNA